MIIGRVAIQKSTGKLLEFQSGVAELGTLTQNCINCGISKLDIEERYVTAPEYETLKQSSKTPEQLSVENKEKLIQEEIRTMAIERLTTKRLI